MSRTTALKWRRTLAAVITLGCVWLTYRLLQSVNDSLGDPAMASGWTLLCTIVGLYGLGWRKKRITRPLGSVAMWMQIHTYLGLFALGVFALHVGWPVRGRFEIALASMFLFISVSGGVLLWHSRRIPKLLSAVKRDIRLDDVPAIVQELAHQAHQIVLRCSASAAGVPVTEYYQAKLLPFFIAPRSPLYRCWPTGHRRRQILRELEDLDRYLDSETLLLRRQLAALVIAKDDTDFHAALQRRLRWLMTLHTAMTWSLWMLIALHVVLVLRFSGAVV